MSKITKAKHHKEYLFILFCTASIIVSSMAGSATLSASEFSQMMNPTGNDWWSMFRHDGTHSGFSTMTAPNTAEVLWTYQTDFIISSSPAVSHGRVYVGSWDRNIYCLEMDSGTLLWNYSTISEITSSPAVVDGNVYVGSQDTYLYCLDAFDGSFLWSFKTGFIVDTSPTVIDEKVYFGSSDGSLYCLNTLDGSLVWEYETNSAFVSSPAVFDGKVYVGIVNGEFVCLNSLTGELLWVFPTTSGIYSAPTVENGKIFFGANDNNVYCLNAYNGSLIWSYDAGFEVHSSPSIAYGYVFIGTSDGRMLCLNKETGAFVWEYVINGSVECSPGVADGKVYFVTDPCCGYTSYLFCLNADTGALVWNYNLNTQLQTKSSPALAAGKVFVGSGDGKFYAFGDIQYLADANGPYYGFMDSPIEFTGSVYGGEPGYSWFWDLGDGTTSTQQNPLHTYTSLGEYAVSLTVTDNLGQIATDDTIVFIDVPNTPPMTPTVEGPISGSPAKPMEFIFTTSDQNDDKILYYIDWGDGITSGRIGPFNSGDALRKNHTWVVKGDYMIQVKAKDWHGAESAWSDPFELSIVAPDLTIDIKGGLGVLVTISNKGDAPAIDISCNISIDKGRILTTQTSFDLQPGGKIPIRVIVLGFGKTTIMVKAGCSEGVSVNRTVQAKLFFLFVYGIR